MPQLLNGVRWGDDAYSFFTKLGDMLTDAGEGLKEMVKTAWNAFVNASKVVGSKIADLAVLGWDGIKKAFSNFCKVMQSFGVGVAKISSKIFEKTIDISKVILEHTKDFFIAAKNVAVAGAIKLGEGLKVGIQKTGEFFTFIGGKIKDFGVAVKDNFVTFANKVGDGFKNLAPKVKDFFTSAKTKFVAAGAGIALGIKSLGLKVKNYITAKKELRAASKPEREAQKQERRRLKADRAAAKLQDKENARLEKLERKNDAESEKLDQMKDELMQEKAELKAEKVMMKKQLKAAKKEEKDREQQEKDQARREREDDVYENNFDDYEEDSPEEALKYIHTQFTRRKTKSALSKVGNVDELMKDMKKVMLSHDLKKMAKYVEVSSLEEFLDKFPNFTNSKETLEAANNCYEFFDDLSKAMAPNAEVLTSEEKANVSNALAKVSDVFDIGFGLDDEERVISIGSYKSSKIAEDDRENEKSIPTIKEEIETKEENDTKIPSKSSDEKKPSMRITIDFDLDYFNNASLYPNGAEDEVVDEDTLLKNTFGITVKDMDKILKDPSITYDDNNRAYL